MARVSIGREIVRDILTSGVPTLKQYLDEGWDTTWLYDREKPFHSAVFDGTDGPAYGHLLKYFNETGRVPSLDRFRYDYPEQTYPLPDSRLTTPEIIEVARFNLGDAKVAWANDDISAAYEAGNHELAAQLMVDAGQDILRGKRTGIRKQWDDQHFALDKDFLNREILRGPGFGIKEMDDAWPGAQGGQLITMLGRAKSGKTTFELMSAYNAWKGTRRMRGQEIEPRRVLFVTHEINAEGVMARLTCYGAGVDPELFLAPISEGDLDPQTLARKTAAKPLVRKFWDENIVGYDSTFQVVQPTSRYTAADLEMDVDAFGAQVVYVDGFYFMTDADTGYSGADWRGHDNLARDLKGLALRKNVPLFVTHQLREKQLGKAGGGVKDDGAMMSGTGLRMASDMVLTYDKDIESGGVVITNTASRLSYLPTISGKWDWHTFRFDAQIKVETEDEGEDEDTSDFQ